MKALIFENRVYVLIKDNKSVNGHSIVLEDPHQKDKYKGIAVAKGTHSVLTACLLQIPAV